MQQHERALALAQHVRLARVEFVRTSHALSREEQMDRLLELLYNPPDWARNWRLSHALTAVRSTPQCRNVICSKVSPTAHSRPIGDLSVRQLDVIAACLAVWLEHNNVHLLRRLVRPLWDHRSLHTA